MPYIHTQVTCRIDRETEVILKEKLGEAIGLLPGKSETYLMLRFEDNCRMWLAGEDAPAAMVEVSIFGTAPAEAKGRMTERICAVFGEVLSIPAARIYVKYTDTPDWGWNGFNL